MFEIQVVVFRVGNEEFCFEIFKVWEIKEMMFIIRVFNVFDYVEGVINFCGQIIMVVNFKKKLGYYDDEDLSNKKIIIVEVKGEIVGIIVDVVLDVVMFMEDQIELMLKIFVLRMDIWFIKGIVKINNGERLLIMVDLDKFFGEEW